ncbi:hypothetical protein RJG79_04860 [Mycoplasmatota bacterium WC44]
MCYLIRIHVSEEEVFKYTSYEIVKFDFIIDIENLFYELNRLKYKHNMR